MPAGISKLGAQHVVVRVRRTRICLFASLAVIVPVYSSKRSLRVLLPWSMCATMQKFRYRSIGIAAIRASISDGVPLPA